MTYDEISPVMRMFMGNREGFRKLGFPADDLYIQIAMSPVLGCLACFCVLKAQGNQFSVLCGPVPNGDADAFAREYKWMCEHQHELPQPDADRIWQESEVFANSDFVIALQAKGFRIPRRTN